MFKTIDATELFKLTQEGIDKESFEDAKKWIIDNFNNKLKTDPECIISFINKKTNHTYYWSKKEIDDFVDTLNKLEELYKKRSPE